MNIQEFRELSKIPPKQVINGVLTVYYDDGDLDEATKALATLTSRICWTTDIEVISDFTVGYDEGGQYVSVTLHALSVRAMMTGWQALFDPSWPSRPKRLQNADASPRSKTLGHDYGSDLLHVYSGAWKLKNNP